MKRFFIYINLVLAFVLIVLFLKPSSAYAVTASNTNYTFFENQANLDSNLSSVRCTGCSLPWTQCWNDQTPGQTACGTKQGCVHPDTGLPDGKSWSSYSFNEDNCRLSDALNNTCTAGYVFNSVTYSTGDKFNSDNPPVLNFGTCQGNVGNPYKTCCSGTTPVSANAFAVDPYDPLEGGCGNNTAVTCEHPTCISGTTCIDPNVQCGQAACAQLGGPTPPPSTCSGTALTCTNPQCPSGYTVIKLTSGNYVCANQSTGQIDCNVKPFCTSACPTTAPWTGEQCACGSGNVATTCASDPNKCNTCSLKYCLQYTLNLCCYYNEPTCFKNDSANCKGLNCTNDKCIPGSTRTSCSVPNVCPAP